MFTRIAKNLSCLLVCLLAIVGPCLATDGFRFPTERITVIEWATYLAEVKALPGVQIKEGDQQITISQAKPNAVIYSFTTAKNPAHPGVVIREIVKRGDGYYIDRKGYYGGDIREFDRWWHAFDVLDEKIKNDLTKKAK
jgi:hypothetical protein